MYQVKIIFNLNILEYNLVENPCTYPMGSDFQANPVVNMMNVHYILWFCNYGDYLALQSLITI